MSHTPSEYCQAWRDLYPDDPCPYPQHGAECPSASLTDVLLDVLIPLYRSGEICPRCAAVAGTAIAAKREER